MSRLMVLLTGVIWLGLAGFSEISMASGSYEEVAVSNGGTLIGKVTLKGVVPEPRIFPVVLYPFGPFCKKISDGHGNIRLEEFFVSSDGGMQDTIVAVQQVKRGKPFPHINNELVAVDCMFHPADVPDSEQFVTSDKKGLRHAHPLVMALENHRPISVVNKDPIIHNGQVFQSERGNIILNFPLPVSDEPRGGILDFEPGKRISQMICGMHEFMQSWGFVVDNPYYAKTKRNGEFAIDRLPPGTYQVVAWHPHLKPIEREMTVPANGRVTINFEFDAGSVQRPIYERQDKFRIGPEAHPGHGLDGCEVPYC